MENKKSKFLFLATILIFLPMVSSAHYIVGYVNNARDGTISNGMSVILWKGTNITDNLTDIIGPIGNSGRNNLYMIDCELLNSPCNIGDSIKITVINNGSNYISLNSSVTITGSGFNVAPNITLNSPPTISSLIVDDDILSPLNQIDLIAGGNRTVNCIAIVNDLDNDSLQNYSSRFFDNSNSNYLASDDNNSHYINNSCYLNTSYIGTPGDNQIICSLYVQYYANPGQWNCIFKIEDNLTISKNSTNITNMNQLLAIGVDSPVNYSFVGTGFVSGEIAVNITNYGNVKMNLSLKGYAVSDNDGFAMNCSSNNISVMYEKYNLTNSTPGQLTLQKFQSNYTNLTGSAVIKKFNLNYRQQDSYNEAINTTYWRIYANPGISGSCSGYIQLGAVIGQGS